MIVVPVVKGLKCLTNVRKGGMATRPLSPNQVNPNISSPSAFDPFVGTGSNAGFGQLIGWGTGAQGAAARASSITLQELQAAKITCSVAKHWLNFYSNAVANGQGGAAALERVKLMQRILELLGGG